MTFILRYFKNGAENRIRTDDLRITNALLYQLSYLGAFPVTMGILTDPGVAGNFRIYQLCQFCDKVGEKCVLHGQVRYMAQLAQIPLIARG